MFNKILIANRGEIAVRIIRACREMGIKTAAVFSEADADAMHVKYADEKVCIGPPASAESYLHIPSIIAAAEITNADAIHPGSGFLSEVAHFAEICKECSITFIGPSAQNIEMMGDKARARKEMSRYGLKPIPGSKRGKKGVIEDENQALIVARELGYPVMIKAVGGGGGRGIRAAHNDVSLINVIKTAQAEAQAAFGNPELYMEKLIQNAKHIEFQVMADNYGKAVHLGERECTIQRRHQKLIEESPSPALDAKLREEIGKSVVKAVRSMKYSNVGTVEFLMDEKKNFYFMEMNTRIQVEHPVTEMITGIDLVKEQIRLASGERVRYEQKDVNFNGHAIECRINAEDPFNGFAPSPGKITAYHPPGGPGIRVDSHVYVNYLVPPYYDSLLAKLIAYGQNREEAILRMQRALDEFIIEGVKNTIPFHRKVMADERFVSGEVHLDFIESFEIKF